MRRAFRDAIAIARAEGATGVCITQTGRHPRLCFTFAGRKYEHVIANTPSDGNALRRVAANVRQAIREGAVR